MNFGKFFLILKKCFGDARFSRYKRLKEKYEIFKILLRLSLKSEFGANRDSKVSQKIFEFTISGTSYKEILYLFREIFMEYQYSFTPKNKKPKILDCGANIGMAVIFFKRMYPDCFIIAFEPNPEVFKLLKKNINENNLRNIEIYNRALSFNKSSVNFYIDSENTLISSLDSNRGGGSVIKVESDRLSDYTRNEIFDLAKIDVEGSEGEIVRDLDETRSINRIHQYIVEYHHNIKNASGNLSSFLKVFEANGFDYNLKSSFYDLGSYQDISIHFYKKSEMQQ
jgi:FkbM family methyltransferase